MNEQEALEITLKQWDYIAMYGCNKTIALAMLNLPRDMRHDCACCEYTKKIPDSIRNCSKCPISWPITYYISDINEVPCQTSYYLDYLHPSNIAEKKEAARAIAALALKTLNEKYPEEPPS